MKNKKEFKYNSKRIVLLKDTIIENKKYIKNTKLTLNEVIADELIKSNNAYEDEKVTIDKNMKIGVTIQVMISLAMIITLNVLLLFGIGLLGLFIILETIYFVTFVTGIIILKKISPLKKEILLIMNIFILFSLYNIKKGNIYY